MNVEKVVLYAKNLGWSVETGYSEEFRSDVFYFSSPDGVLRGVTNDIRQFADILPKPIIRFTLTFQGQPTVDYGVVVSFNRQSHHVVIRHPEHGAELCLPATDEQIDEWIETGLYDRTD